jgi:hypothetical protein
MYVKANREKRKQASKETKNNQTNKIPLKEDADYTENI